MVNKDIVMARRLAKQVDKAGGRVYYVGGFVRDKVMGRDNKDVDVEVHGIPPKKLEEILDGLGQKTVMGASFGIYGLRHIDLDIAMPRSEKATGRGHKDFEVFVDPFLGTEKAAKRRDFTINALMQDVLTEEILDYFGGIGDLKKGVIRHVNDESFQEDPLRVLRCAQFAARFRFDVAPETVSLCATMDLSALARERIMDELNKALLKSDAPRIFFDVLKRMNALNVWFQEIDALSASDDEYEFAMRLLDRAAARRHESANPLAFMLSALICTLNGDRVKRAISLLDKLTSEIHLRRYVENMARLSDEPEKLLNANADKAAFMRMFDQSSAPADLALLSAVMRECADSEKEKRLADAYEQYISLMKEDEVKGEDLIKSGIKPGKAMGALIAYAHDLHLSGIKKDEALQMALARAKES